MFLEGLFLLRFRLNLIKTLQRSTALNFIEARSGREDYEYVRNGVINVFMANEPLKGEGFVEVIEFKTNRLCP
jgi:hypothetical protein